MRTFDLMWRPRMRGDGNKTNEGRKQETEEALNYGDGYGIQKYMYEGKER